MREQPQTIDVPPLCVRAAVSTVSEEKRTVRCRDCDTLLDPFQVLWQMAIKERRWLSDLETWEARRDSLLGERYDAEWIKHVEDVVDPPSNPRLREIWDTFHAYMGDKFCAMYRRKHRQTKGTLWYGRDVRGSCVSIEYVRSQLAPKLIATKEAQ